MLTMIGGETLEVASNAKFFEDFAGARRWRDPRRTITETDVVMFAAPTVDREPVHTDEDFARHVD